MTERGLSVGLLVKQEKWGLGKVIHLDPQDVWVYFKDVEGTPKVCRQAIESARRSIDHSRETVRQRAG